MRDDEMIKMMGRKLAHARKSARLTQTQVIRHISGDDNSDAKSKISEIESGKVTPSLDTLQKLCLLYGVSVDWVLGLVLEPDIDHNAARVGFMYSMLFERLAPMLHDITANFAAMGAKQFASLPKSCVMDLLERNKQFIASRIKSGEPVGNELAALMQVVRECEVTLARAEMENLKELDEIGERELSDWDKLYIDCVQERISTTKQLLNAKQLKLEDV